MRLGPLTPEGYLVRRSGIRWLREDGATVRPGEAAAFCNVGLTPQGAAASAPFAEEWLDVQAVLAPRVGGVLRHGEMSSRGGFLDQLDHFQIWRSDDAIGSVEPGRGPALPGPADEARLFMTAGRRQADLAEGRQGVLTGWHDRVRAWRAEGEGPLGAVASLGTCEMHGVLRGERAAFLELFESVAGPAHVIQYADEPLPPMAPILLELGRRGEAERQAIADDCVGYLTDARAQPVEWIFAGALLKALARAPLTDGFDILGRAGLRRMGPADAIVLSASAEGSILRHRTLGYALTVHGFRAARAGATVHAWLDAAFERVLRSVDEVARDYRALLAAMRAGGANQPRHVLIVNVMSTTGDDDIQSYQAFDAPMGETLATVHARDLNLMLADLARDEPGVSIVDLDAIAADVGGQRNLPDNIHASGLLQAELRGEIVRILAARGVPGFTPAALS